MDLPLGGLYRATVTQVNSDSLVVDVEELGLKNLYVEHCFTFGYVNSETGFRNIKPKKDDEILVFFEGAEHHRPIAVMGARFKVSDLKDDEAEIATETDKIKMHKDGINIGSDDSSQPLVLGYKYLEYIAKVFNHLSAVGSAVGIPPMTFGLRAPTKDQLSDRHKTEKGD